jgi:hypothetical protein
MITEEILSKIKKVKALAERGSPGEKECAAGKLKELCDKYKINPDELVECFTGKQRPVQRPMKPKWMLDEDFDIMMKSNPDFASQYYEYSQEFWKTWFEKNVFHF